jgi:hypothetical protein
MAVLIGNIAILIVSIPKAQQSGSRVSRAQQEPAQHKRTKMERKKKKGIGGWNKTQMCTNRECFRPVVGAFDRSPVARSITDER